MLNSSRKIKQIIEPKLVIEGAGVLLRRSFGPTRANPYDPFLLFDHFAFNDPIEGPIRGFPTHPHRGIETVTYMLEGNVRHRDSLGNMGVINPGDVQWMTSGGGILHEEMPRRGPSGLVIGFQLWVNLPAKEKMGKPHYRELNSGNIPIVEKGGVKVRLIAGEYRGNQGPVTEIVAKPIYMDVTIAPNTEMIIPISKGHSAMAYLFEGEALFEVNDDLQEKKVEAVHMIAFDDGDHLRLRTGTGSNARFMLMAGESINEPIVPYGPFVMNAQEEIHQALKDLRNGTFVRN